jgi:hypothetical protein
VRMERLELSWVSPPPPQDGVSASSTTSAIRGVGRYIGCSSCSAQHRGHNHCAPADLGLHDGGRRVRVVCRIGGANKYVSAAECEVVVAPAVRSGAERVHRLGLSLRIDDHEIWIAVLVLHRPELVALGIHSKSIIVAKDGVGCNDIAVWLASP